MSVAGYTHWSEDETATLRAMWPTTCTIPEIAAKIPGRNQHAVANKAEKLRLGARPNYWTAERTELVTTMWLAGHSSAQIARKMGVTRNVIIGKTQRLKLQGRDRPSHPSRVKAIAGKTVKPVKIAKPKAPPVKRGPTNPGAVGMHHAGDGSGHAPRAYVKRGGPVESPNPVDIMGLGPRMCKAVIEDDPTVYYCGNAKPHDATYCPAHAACYYLPSQPKKMRPDSRW